MQFPKRTDIATLIANRISQESERLKAAYAQSGGIRHFVVDDLLPLELANRIASAFPAADAMKFKDTLRERKYISSQMNQYDPLVEEALFAFHDEQVVAAVHRIVGHPTLYPDPKLYAGGISRMEQGCFLNPHLDNSHDKERQRWRALNLLYYISPGWQDHFGGNLEIWPYGVKDAPVMIESRFNRLAIMATHHQSWHSVSPVHAAQARCCISNYYFSDQPMLAGQPFHVTSFRGRPEQPIRDVMLQADALLRNTLRAIKRQGFFKTGHWYEAQNEHKKAA